MSDTQLHTDIAGLRADLQNTNKNVERIADSLEKTLGDHETRIRALEEAATGLRTFILILKWLGPAGTLGIFAFAVWYVTKQ